MKVKIILIIALCLASHAMVKAQIIDVCGSDTITLVATNYQGGQIQWESAIDTSNWNEIENAVDTTYTFYPTQTKYYRARVNYEGCPN